MTNGSTGAIPRTSSPRSSKVGLTGCRRSADASPTSSCGRSRRTCVRSRASRPRRRAPAATTTCSTRWTSSARRRSRLAPLHRAGFRPSPSSHDEAMNWAGSIFDTAGSQAERIARLAWFIIAVSTVTYVLVLAATAIAVRRARGRASRGELADQQPETERRLARNVTIATVATTLLLLVYVTATARTGRAIAWPTDAERPLTIEVTGHQWWWEFRYRDSVSSNWLTTSNEMHIPVGRPVQVVLQSNDVIHSFWVPELHGKQDLIPGHKNTTWLRADKPGVWKARCAEFCGYQHAKMAFDVVAETPAQFNQWYVRQLASALEPTDSSAMRGRDVFAQRTCIMCHT